MLKYIQVKKARTFENHDLGADVSCMNIMQYLIVSCLNNHIHSSAIEGLDLTSLFSGDLLIIFCKWQLSTLYDSALIMSDL